MKKILLGLLAVLLIAVGGYFGFQFYVQQRIAGEIDTAFDQIRNAGGKASHGRVSFDLWTRTLSVVDIAAETAAQPPVTVKIANLVAAGVGQPDATHFAAVNIEAGDIEVGARMAAQQSWAVTYKVPRIMVKDYSGPASIEHAPTVSSVVDIYRFVAGLFKDIAASSVTVPSLTFTIKSGAAVMAEGGYSGLAMTDIKDANIAIMKTDQFDFTVNTQQAGKTDKLAGKVADFVITDFDGEAAATTLDPSKKDDDHYYRVYRQISIGAYDITSGQGVRTHIGGIVADDVGVRPSRVQLAEILSMSTMLPPATIPTPSEAREMIEKAARFYEGIRIGNAVASGISVEAPQGPRQQTLAKLSAMRFSLKDGKGDLGFEGLDASTPNGPFRMNRFTLKALDLPNLMRLTALFSNPAQRPPPEQWLRLFQVLEGIEVGGVVAPFKNTSKKVTIDAINLNWGQFVGSIPTKAHLDAKLAGPVDASSPAQQALAIAGIDAISTELNLSANWDEASGSFVLDAPTLELSSLLKASARVALAKVPRGAFTLDPQQATAMAAQIEAGGLELTLRDLGGVDLLVAQYARTHKISREAARSAIVDEIRADSEKAATANPDAPGLIEALIRFVQTPGETLAVKLTPLGAVSASQLMQLLKSDPEVALSQFRIEASTGL